MFSDVVCLFHGFLGHIAINKKSKNPCSVACDVKTELQTQFEKNMFVHEDYIDPAMSGAFRIKSQPTQLERFKPS